MLVISITYLEYILFVAQIQLLQPTNQLIVNRTEILFLNHQIPIILIFIAQIVPKILFNRFRLD